MSSNKGRITRQIIATTALGTLGIATLSGTFAGTASARLVSHHTPSCATVTAGQIKSALGVTVGKTKVVTAASTTTCTYGSSSMIIQIGGGMTSASFASARKSFDAHGEPTKTVTGIGTAAFSSTIGAGPYVTNTFVVRKGSNQLLVTAGHVTLAKIELLAKVVLTSL